METVAILAATLFVLWAISVSNTDFLSGTEDPEHHDDDIYL